MWIDPETFFAIVAAAHVVALAAVAIRRSRLHRSLDKWAARNGWQYVPEDKFDLAARSARSLEVAAAADVAVSDVLYRSEPEGRRYVYRVHYTVGAMQVRRREHRFMVAVEPRHTDVGGPLRVTRVEAAPLSTSSYERLAVGAEALDATTSPTPARDP
jgi:hypothetical protein